MKKWYITFGQASPFKDNWIEIVADNEFAVRQWANRYPHWCGCYDEEYWLDQNIAKWFPGGRSGDVLILSEVPA